MKDKTVLEMYLEDMKAIKEIDEKSLMSLQPLFYVEMRVQETDLLKVI